MRFAIPALLLFIATLSAVSGPALAQLGVEIGPGGVQIGPTRRGPYYEERRVVRDGYERMARRCRLLVRNGEYDSWRECMDENGY